MGIVSRLVKVGGMRIHSRAARGLAACCAAMTPEILLPALLAAVILLILLAIIALRKLSHIERMLNGAAKSSPREKQAGSSAQSDVDTTADELSGPFLEFLDEDSARRELPKKEQFAAYRRWRSERGLNWRSR